ncbi:hypothetical protein [Sphingobacterium multivorum]|uniref:hypothetical protein n=1 Tax=Sphingobacterium multivorum TaxID=28454 RepID=UPI0028AA7B87|nr:hypothetical protein [Sphingobacterium multivorum]
MEKNDLHILIARLIELVKVQEVYAKQIVLPEATKIEIVIIMRAESGCLLGDYNPLLDSLFAQFGYISYTILNCDLVKKQLLKGSLLFHMLFREENLIYVSPSSCCNLIGYIDATQIDVEKKASKRFEDDFSKICALFEGALFYTRQKNLPLASFMLHQQLEQTYRAAEILLMGRDLRSHCIIAHQHYISSYSFGLGCLFDAENKPEYDLLRRIDSAYVDVRYATEYSIKVGKLEIALKKGFDAMYILNESYKTLVSDYREKTL